MRLPKKQLTCGERFAYIGLCPHPHRALLNARVGVESSGCGPRQGEGPHPKREAVLFLLRSDFVTGQVTYVHGGRPLKGRMYG
jgi:hypothetical protein